MKLNIGENIRKHRREANLTQEQLAEKLGVSFQAISRWENETTYPDMELLPAIAKFFGISVDQLLGCPEEEKEKSSEKALHDLAVATYEDPIDKEKIISIIRDIRRNHLESSQLWRFWLDAKHLIFCDPEILPEVRLTAEAILEKHSGTGIREITIQNMARIEDEEHIAAFLERYASELDISRNSLLLERYKNRCEYSKLRPAMQWNFFMLIDKMIGNSDPWRDREKHLDLEECRYMNELNIELLHRINRVIPDENHPITADGSIDFWAEPRLWMGFRQAAYLASSGEQEKAFIYLEDAVSLLEKFLSITEPTEISCKSPWLDQIVWTAQEDWCKPNLLPEEPFERCVYLHRDGTCYMFYPSWFYDFLTSNNHWWKWFDPIREDERFTKYVGRVKALISKK